MNIQADPVGYKALSRHFAAAREVDSQLAEEVHQQTRLLRLGSTAVVGLLLIAVLVLLHATRAVAMPVVMGLVVGLILTPVADKGEGYGIPGAVTVLAIVGGLLAALAGIIYLMMPSLPDVAASIPRIKAGFAGLLAQLEGVLAMLDGLRKGAEAGGGAIVTETRTSTVDMAARAMEIATPTLSQAIIFLFTLLMFIASRQEIRQALVLSFTNRERRLSVIRSFNEAQARLADYLFTVSLINAGLGSLVATAFWLAGIPGAGLWGFLAFTLNYLPVVGPLLLKGLLLVFGIATYPGEAAALAPLGLFLALSLIEANVVTPRIVGQRITMSPLLVFLSVVIWTWMWGFAGAFLAMPLLALASVVHAEFAECSDPKLPG